MIQELRVQRLIQRSISLEGDRAFLIRCVRLSDSRISKRKCAIVLARINLFEPTASIAEPHQDGVPAKTIGPDQIHVAVGVNVLSDERSVN